MLIFRFAGALLVAALCLPCSGQQALKLPSELTFLSTWGQVGERYAYESWGQVTFPAYGPNQVDKKGRHWNLVVGIPGTKDRLSAWAVIKPVVLKNGWTVVSENPNGGFLAVLHYNQAGVDVWVNATVVDATPPRLMADTIEIAPPPISLTLAPPGATPEAMPPGGRGDFPYLAQLPGSESRGGQVDSGPFRLKPKGSPQEEIVANGSISRGYTLKGLSQPLFEAVYHDALTKAGWEILQETANGEVIDAHYGKNGRNLWAHLRDGGDTYGIQVGIEGAPDQMKSSLAAACHVAVYGVLFDFNKTTLQPASNGPLQQVATLLAANPALAIEVQGHTDNAGGDAYNQTLSEGRARAVVKWLTDHGVASARMTAKGYGKTMPVADNNTDEGRMKNRRVEIADPSCKPKQ